MKTPPLAMQSITRCLVFSSLTIGSLAGFALLGGCSTSSWLRKADSRLPIEIVPAKSERIATIRAHETADRLYVSGSALPHQFGNTYVQVQLIGSEQQVIATKDDSLASNSHPLMANARSGKQTYVVSFPLEEARRAETIRVCVRQGRPENNS